MDEAASHIAVHSAVLAERHELADRRVALVKEREELEAQSTEGLDEAALEERYKVLADKKAEELRIENRISKLENAVSESKNFTQNLYGSMQKLRDQSYEK